jgi:hypothetical protein
VAVAQLWIVRPLRMTKHDWTWLIVRGFGIYLLVQAVIAIPSVMSSAFGFYETFPIVHSFDANLDRMSQTLRSHYFSELFNSSAKLVICGSFGVYLVRSGSWLFKILCPPDSQSK